MASSSTWIQSQRIAIAAGNSWIMQASRYVDGFDYKTAFAWFSFLNFAGGGTLTVRLQAAVYASRNNDAWVDLQTGTISADGDLVFQITQASTQLVTGPLRIKIDCATANTTFALRTELLLKAHTGSQFIEWMPPTAVSVTSGSDVTMPADLWIDCSQYVNATSLVEFELSSGTASNLTTFIETAASRASETGAFVTVNSSALVDGSTQIAGRASSTNPPMGVLRLRHSSASGSVAGTMRVMLLLKDDN